MAEAGGLALSDLPLERMQEVEPRITGDVCRVLGVDRSVASRTSFGGTAPRNVRREAKRWLRLLKAS
jgi:argininosuccinate lyase